MKKIVLLLAAAMGAVTLSAQKTFTYGDLSKGLFGAKSVYGLRSMNNGTEYTVQDGKKIIRYSYKSGEVVDTLFDGAKSTPEIAFSNYTFSGDEKKILLETGSKPIYRHSKTAKYWIYDLGSQELKPLSGDDKQEVASFSPDGTKVAFVRDNNLFWTDLSTGRETQVTFDGEFNHIINGKADWVYEEEMLGQSKAYEWAPTSDALAFYRTDESQVKEYHMNRFDGNLYPTVYSYKYPKAGETNSVVSVHVYNLNDGKTATMDIGPEKDQYVALIRWNAVNGKLMVYRVNRLQNNFDLLMCDAATGASNVAYNEKNDRYIDISYKQNITPLSDGDRFIVRSEKDGYMHLYLYSLTKGLLNRITEGEWEVTQMLGVDEKSGKVYFISTEGSPLRRALYSVKLNGKGKTRITPKEGVYDISFSNGFKYFISYFSSADTPPFISLHTADGKLVRVLEDNKELQERIKEYQLPLREFFTFKTSEGIELNGYMLKPNNFDPNKKYPVFMTQYSGPGSQTVMDNWGVSWESALVEQGYIVVSVDGRGTGARGEDFKKVTYGQLGKYEVIDQIEAAKYLQTLPYVDPARIAIYGWSYGGFMASSCILKGADVFKCAIAVAPVTSWRYYDTIYTEVYNGLPQDNAAGYDDNSPVNFAGLLKGKFLIIHGSADDNVHPQNSYELVSALVREGKQFDMFIYPDKHHGMGPDRRFYDNVINKMILYINENL